MRTNQIFKWKKMKLFVKQSNVFPFRDDAQCTYAHAKFKIMNIMK